MASETGDSDTEPRLIERLINSRNRDLSLFLPMILGFTNNPTANTSVHDLTSPDQETASSHEPRDRIIFINSMTQGMVVIEGSSGTLDSLLRDLLSKDGLPPASKASIDNMPIVDLRDGQEGECVICLEEWESGEGMVKEMPCKHKFHGECIEKWLGIHGSCPVCRYKMPDDVDDDDLSKGNGEGRERRRREVWVSFSFSSDNNRRNDDSNQINSSESIANDTISTQVSSDPEMEA